MRQLAEISRWCDDVTDSASPARFARRSRLRAAVLGARDNSGLSSIPPEIGGSAITYTTLAYTVTGRVLDVSPHILILLTDHGEQRFPLSASAEAWRGGPVSPAALRQGEPKKERQGQSIPHKTRHINLIIIILNKPILLLTFPDSSHILHTSTMFLYVSIHSPQMASTAVFCENRFRSANFRNGSWVSKR